MATFNDYLTVDGQALVAKMLGGKCKIEFTKMAWGDGTVTAGTDLRNIKNLVNTKSVSTNVNAKCSGDNIVEVSAEFTNQELTTGMYLREKGIFASDGVSEVLMIYANNGSLAEYIEPAIEGLIEKTMRSVMTFNQSDNINIKVKSAAFVYQSDFDEHVENTDNPHHVTAQQVDTPMTFEDYTGSAAVPTLEDAIAGIVKKNKISVLFQNLKAFAQGSKTLFGTCVKIGQITQQNVNNQSMVPSSALLYALNAALVAKDNSLQKAIDTVNSNLTAEVSKKTNTSNLPYGFRNIFTSLWTETAGGPDDADFGLIVRTPPAGYSGDTAYYFTFYEGGNGNKSYGIQICLSRQGAFVPMYRAKQGGRWSGWVAI